MKRQVQPTDRVLLSQCIVKKRFEAHYAVLGPAFSPRLSFPVCQVQDINEDTHKQSASNNLPVSLNLSIPEKQPQPQITYLRAMFGVEKNVERLQVSVPGVVLVEVREPLSHVADEVSTQLLRNKDPKQPKRDKTRARVDVEHHNRWLSNAWFGSLFVKRQQLGRTQQQPQTKKNNNNNE